MFKDIQNLQTRMFKNIQKIVWTISEKKVKQVQKKVQKGSKKGAKKVQTILKKNVQKRFRTCKSTKAPRNLFLLLKTWNYFARKKWKFRQIHNFKYRNFTQKTLTIFVNSQQNFNIIWISIHFLSYFFLINKFIFFPFFINVIK